MDIERPRGHLGRGIPKAMTRSIRTPEQRAADRERKRRHFERQVKRRGVFKIELPLDDLAARLRGQRLLPDHRDAHLDLQNALQFVLDRWLRERVPDSPCTNQHNAIGKCAKCGDDHDVIRPSGVRQADH